MTDGKASNARRPRAPKVPQVRGWKCFNSCDVILHQIMSREAASCEAQPLSHVQQLVMDRLSSITTLKIRCKMCLSYVVVEKDSLWCLVPCWPPTDQWPRREGEGTKEGGGEEAINVPGLAAKCRYLSHN